MTNILLETKNLNVSVEGKHILKDFSLQIPRGEVHALMGRNGSGKTSLANVLMGHPRYQIESGEILFKGQVINDLSPEERAKLRIFLSFQYPVAIPGVSLAHFLRTAVRAVRGQELSAKELRQLIQDEAKALDVPDSFMTRSINEGFSGGEKKKLETLQLRLLQPELAILDETDSGLDIDALRLIANRIENIRSENRSILLITHYQRLLDYIQPDRVHVMLNGRIAKSGDKTLAKELEERGYEWIEKEAA
ncbi:MAG: Fe-S cluster assembly ATPase SufC [Bdellovibrionota bacterium]|jgi:Fe-S cluster assembly ATP-binding protein